MIIFIDADACPVKEETIKVAGRYDLPVKIVSNGGMRPSRDPMIETIVVAAGADAADDWIAERCNKDDIVITSDIPLAARIIDAHGIALGPTGKVFTEETIGMALAVRDLKQHLRESTQSQTYNRGFEPRDRSNFLQALDRLVVQAINRRKSDT
ncbi:MAG: YaiI/YqxD family protein [Rhizobiaceae bacterium]|nr:YaiI/YqxD family protein [Rhizobiaceae bacterium]